MLVIYPSHKSLGRHRVTSNVRRCSPLIAMDRASEKQRYYFDLVNGETISFDEDGMELPDIAAAQEEAALALAALAKELRSIPASGLPRALAIEVRDDVGPVFKVQFTFETHQLQ